MMSTNYTRNGLPVVQPEVRDSFLRQNRELWQTKGSTGFAANLEMILGYVCKENPSLIDYLELTTLALVNTGVPKEGVLMFSQGYLECYALLAKQGQLYRHDKSQSISRSQRDTESGLPIVQAESAKAFDQRILESYSTIGPDVYFKRRMHQMHEENPHLSNYLETIFDAMRALEFPQFAIDEYICGFLDLYTLFCINHDLQQNRTKDKN